MSWVLLMWVFGCEGIHCPVPEPTIMYFETENECFAALNAWHWADKKNNRGICREQ